MNTDTKSVKRRRGRPTRAEAAEREAARLAEDPLADVRDAADEALRAARKTERPGDKAKLLQVWMQCQKMIGSNAAQSDDSVRPEFERFLAEMRRDHLAE